MRERGLNFRYRFGNPKRHILARNHVFRCILRKIDVRVFAVGDWKKQKIEKHSRHKAVCKVAHAQKRNRLSDLDEIWHFGSYP